MLILAPMQDVTDLPFWKLMHRYGGPDIYFTEYFRVHPNSTPEKKILACIRENPAQRPVIAQMIGQDLPALIRTAEFLQKEGVKAIDLNIGCPAPIVCKKSSGGGMLRNLEHLAKVIGTLRETIQVNFTLKTRIGFYEKEEFDEILKVYAQFPVDLLTVHGRTVKEMYRSEVHLDRIAQAVETMPCPVIANGNVLSAGLARHTIDQTGAAGLMIGRGAIRNPWVWNQIRELYENGKVSTLPSLRDLREYISILYDMTRPEALPEKLHVAKMKKYMNFITQKIDPEDAFLHQIRRTQTEKAFFEICDQFLDQDGPFEVEPPEKSLVNAGNPRNDCY